MDIKPLKIELQCLFCDSALTGKDDAKFESGDLIKCAECGEENDFDSVLEIAKQKGLLQMKEQVLESIKKAFK